ncbi:ImmA/IrrE family metallo-endopeptidase [Mesorhizobium sp. WSM4906]|uniref:ImmA/IrrE family metallo-endopeptidase n=1 Tax=Mesorhizobium sp. WSM4906 TaxID=3038546 RepID=UPI0024164B49|nr:ImmA/IrrE family metallo-endopeptidase [Mesorhizobium sp. WSM4906]WFP73385.1 ImmA/IrrE family metallo-endopeptidase [Mesorhizobium sp. WSM4906]
MSPEWHSLDHGMIALIKEHHDSAPVRLSAIAQALGVKVIATALPNGISGEIRPDPDAAGQYIVKVNRNDSSRRQRFTVAHELGHFLLHRDQIGDGITDDVLYRSELSDRREAQANRMAADLLMPQQLVDDWLDRAKTLRIDNVVGFLADKFNVSEAAMKIRLGIP